MLKGDKARKLYQTEVGVFGNPKRLTQESEQGRQGSQAEG
jgi:hypothetical protein